MLQSVDMGRPKKYNYPENMTFDRSSGRYVVRNPLTKKTKKFRDGELALKTVEKLNEWIACQRQLEALADGRPKIGGLVEKWMADRLPFMPWDGTTRRNNLSKMRRIGRELGTRFVAQTDCMFLEDWLVGFCHTADQFNKWRYMLTLLWKFAVSRNMAAANEAEKIETRSLSKKLEANQKKRKPLDIPTFKEIHEKAPPWLQLAMELSLVTLQGRLEICNLRHTDYRDDHLYVIRDKVSGDSDMAFIKIKLTDQLEELRRRAISLDNIASPYIIHRSPQHRRRQWTEGKPHWAYINPNYLTTVFATCRDLIPRLAELLPGERPTFHEIRGLGARIYLDQGMSEAAIQALMTHASKRTTEIYLEGGIEALKDSDYLPVVAPLVLKEIIK